MINKNIIDNINIDYDTEREANRAPVLLAANYFTTILRKAGLSYDVISDCRSVRFEEMLSAATQDIIRYAIYHPIQTSENNSLLISESVRASYLTKWVMTFRPLDYDKNLPDAYCGKVKKVTPGSNATLLKDDKFNYQYYCNEYFAIFIASAIIKPKYDDKLVNIIDYIKLASSSNPDSAKNELESLFYNLRYRINHQDVYHLFYNRILHAKPYVLSEDK